MVGNDWVNLTQNQQKLSTYPLGNDPLSPVLETLVMTNSIKEVIVKNNWKLAKEYDAINAQVDHHLDQIVNLTGKVKDLKEVVHLQRAIINSCHNQTAALEETIVIVMTFWYVLLERTYFFRTF